MCALLSESGSIDHLQRHGTGTKSKKGTKKDNGNDKKRRLRKWLFDATLKARVLRVTALLSSGGRV